MLALHGSQAAVQGRRREAEKGLTAEILGLYSGDGCFRVAFAS